MKYTPLGGSCSRIYYRAKGGHVPAAACELSAIYSFILAWRMFRREKWRLPLSPPRTSHAPAESSMAIIRERRKMARTSSTKHRWRCHIIFRLQTKNSGAPHLPTTKAEYPTSCKPDVTLSAQELMWSRVNQCCCAADGARSSSGEEQ